MIFYGFKNEDIDYWQGANDRGPDFRIDAKKIHKRLTHIIGISKLGHTSIFYFRFLYFSGHGYYKEEE